MSNQQPVEHTTIGLIHSISQSTDEATIYSILSFIRTTALTKNHDAIIETLKKCATSLPNKWLNDFDVTIKSVHAQKETAEKIVKYKGFLTHDELGSFMMIYLRMFLHPENPVELSMDVDEKYADMYHVIISSDSGEYLDNDFSPKGILNGYVWSKRFTRIPALPILNEQEKTNSVTLPSGDVLSFRDGRWWITRSRGGGIDECLRSEAHNLLRENCLVKAVTNEAWADIVKPDQPLLS